MTIKQTVEIPANRRIFFDLPPEIPLGRANFELKVLQFPYSTPEKRKMTKKEEIEYINSNAEELNQEAEDVLLYQDVGSFEDDLEQFTSQDIAFLNDTVVQFSNADIIFDRKNNSPV